MKKAGIFAALAMTALSACGVATMGVQTQPVVHKVFVCKYVGTPGVNERLQDGGNPISVDIHSVSTPVIGAFFADAQGRSVVIAFDTGQPEPSPDNCPTPPSDDPPDTTEEVTDTTEPDTTSVETTEPEVTNPPCPDCTPNTQAVTTTTAPAGSTTTTAPATTTTTTVPVPAQTTTTTGPPLPITE